MQAFDFTQQVINKVSVLLNGNKFYSLFKADICLLLLICILFVLYKIFLKKWDF